MRRGPNLEEADAAEQAVSAWPGGLGARHLPATVAPHVLDREAMIAVNSEAVRAPAHGEVVA